MEAPKAVSNLIKCLTNDEDLRQELWVHYLSGNSVDTFASHLEKVASQYSSHHDLKEAMWSLLNDPPSERMINLLDRFSDFERSIMCLLVIGLCPQELSRYKAISEVRIRHAIATIKANSSWEEIYGIKDAFNR